MKKVVVVSIFFQLFIFSVAAQQLSMSAVELKLSAMKEVNYVKAKPSDGFREAYVLNVIQPLDPKDKAGKIFNQRVFLQVKDLFAPTLVVTEGYSADYAANEHYAEELSAILQSNQVVIEHRYFGTSVPDPLDWKYLTVENAAADHHRIINLLKMIFKGKFISTGISKGGQTAVYHRTFYPGDVDATVAYVAPFNISQEDPREIYFLKNVGTSLTRERIVQFQQNVLKKRGEILPLMLKDVERQKASLAMSADSTLDYLVLEFPFSFWQWGVRENSLPGNDASASQLYTLLSSVVPPSSYTHPGMDYFYPFSYQAYTEIGYYGYDTTYLGKYLAIRGNYISNLVMAPKYSEYRFNPLTLQKVRDFISYKGNNIIYIYGANDPWSASAAMPTTATNSVRFVQKDGNHSARIKSLDQDQKKSIAELLSKWLTMSVQIN
jgi:hypothetical protein